MRFVELSYLKTSKLGKYVQKYMTRTLSIIRILANFVALSGAWYHNYGIIALGVVTILGCWTWGLVLDMSASN
jgi:hypothetical protein